MGGGLVLIQKNMELTSIAIIGSRGTGKTALTYKLLEGFKKPVYVFRHPQPHLIKALGYKVMNEISEVERLQNAVLWIDEPQLLIRGKGKSDKLKLLLSIARQRDVTVIISTSNTRFLDAELESYIDQWLVKDIEPDLVKRGSLVKKILARYAIIDEEGQRIATNEYISHSRSMPDSNGLHTFKLPEYWSEKHSKPFRRV